MGPRFLRNKKHVVFGLLGVLALYVLITHLDGGSIMSNSRESRFVEYTKSIPTYNDVETPALWLSQDWTNGVPNGSEEEKTEHSVQKYTFNAYKSNNIPLRRSHPDFRNPDCKAVQYAASLPTASVVICFINEMWSAVLRTVWSVLDNTPAGLLAEIILVDDSSAADWLGDEFTEYVSKMPSIVRLVRSQSRLGLIRARMLGAQHTTGQVLIFLDAHCEATTGWIEPILGTIGADEKTVICPTIDNVNDRTLDFHSNGGSAIGSFHWTLDFSWQYYHDPKLKPSDPVASPTMAGGLFAIDRDFWHYLGEYDAEMRGWGGENLELSFRIWMCGGQMVFLPCSHVGHIFRGSHPYNVPGGFNENFIRNSARLAEVWMDEYKESYYFVRPQAKTMDLGDLSVRKNQREKLQCKSFQWYLDKFFPGKFVPSPDILQQWGQLKLRTAGKCVDTYGHQHVGEQFGVYTCHPRQNPSQNQAFLMTKTGQLRIIWDLCFDSQGGRVMLYMCNTDLIWKYNEDTGALVHTRTGQCMDIKGNDIVTAPCAVDSPTQQWEFTGFLNG